MQKLVLLGVGGNNADILEAVERLNSVRPTFDVLGYVSPNAPRGPSDDLRYLGDDSGLASLPAGVRTRT